MAIQGAGRMLSSQLAQRCAWTCLAFLAASLAAVGEPSDGWQAEPEPAPAPLPAPSVVPPLAQVAPVARSAPSPGPLARPIESAPPASAPAVPRRPIESTALDGPRLPSLAVPDVFQSYVGPPPGFTGPSGIAPRELQEDGHFVPVEDRWRLGMPPWDRYGKGDRHLDDYPYDVGHWWDPFNQNVLKGDYPILGQHTFLEITGLSSSLFEARQLPTATTPFESTANAGQKDFLGKPNQFLYSQLFELSFDLFHGDASFKPVDWRIKLTPAFNINYLAVEELAVVNPDVRKGTTRGRTFATLQEWFAEAKLADTSPYYDFLSIRAGSQPFVSDFRGFIFSDTNRAIRLFGTREANRDQFNLIYFIQAEKDTNSTLNTFNDRTQQVLIANYFRQDFIWPGYTFEASIHYNHDRPSFEFDRNNFLVRPDPVGVFKPHGIDVVYLGIAGDGHINRFNISNAFYWALGRDSFNPLAGAPQDINAQMAALEVSYDRDWARFRASVFWSSGDGNPNNRHATGFDSILDNPNFAGGQFSFFQRQSIPLFGVGLSNRLSLIPDLRSSKIQGQANFVNPGLQLINAGVDFDLTPKLKMINNYNLLWFDKTAPLETFVFQGDIERFIGADLSMGFEYRPLLSNNVIVTTGLATLLPSDGFRNLYNRFRHTATPLLSAFMQVNLMF